VTSPLFMEVSQLTNISMMEAVPKPRNITMRDGVPELSNIAPWWMESVNLVRVFYFFYFEWSLCCIPYEPPQYELYLDYLL
jgi:hypothetical protein